MKQFKPGDIVKYTDNYKKKNRGKLPWANEKYEITKVYERKFICPVYDMIFVDFTGNCIHIDKISGKYLKEAKDKLNL